MILYRRLRVLGHLPLSSSSVPSEEDSRGSSERLWLLVRRGVGITSPEDAVSSFRMFLAAPLVEGTEWLIITVGGFNDEENGRGDGGELECLRLRNVLD